jgi:hypothetical protein
VLTYMTPCCKYLPGVVVLVATAIFFEQFF